jgi:acyl carrier protein
MTTARCMVAVWAEALGLHVDDDDDFFADLNGTSLRAVELIEAVCTEYGIDVEVDFVFDHPTPTEMHKALSAVLDENGCADK